MADVPAGSDAVMADAPAAGGDTGAGSTPAAPTAPTAPAAAVAAAAAAAPIDAFARMRAGMVKQEKERAKEKEKERARVPKPRGRAPKHYKEWDSTNGKWLEDPDDPPPKIDKFPKPAHRPPAGKVWDGQVGEWVDDPSSAMEADLPEDDDASSSDEDDGDGATSTTKKSRRRSYTRMFNSGWQKHLPWLVCVSVLVATAGGPEMGGAGESVGAGESATSAICPKRGAECLGCEECCVMKCTLCMERGLANSFAVNGCCNFHKKSVTEHAQLYHREKFHDLDRKQSGIVQGFAKQLADEEERLRRIMKNVYWLAWEKLPMKKLKSLCSLFGLHGIPLGKNYINEVMARDMMDSIAHVLRERINVAARTSSALGLMIDESTDVSSSNAMVLYLRLFINATPTTVFWGLVEVHDATANGLVKTIEGRFEDQNVPLDRVFSFASDGASVVICVARLLQAAYNAFMLTCHCIAHRLALGAAGAS